MHAAQESTSTPSPLDSRGSWEIARGSGSVDQRPSYESLQAHAITGRPSSMSDITEEARAPYFLISAMGHYVESGLEDRVFQLSGYYSHEILRIWSVWYC